MFLTKTKPTLRLTVVAINYADQVPTFSIDCFFPPILMFKMTRMAQLFPSELQIASQVIKILLSASSKV